MFHQVATHLLGPGGPRDSNKLEHRRKQLVGQMAWAIEKFNKFFEAQW